MHEVPIIRGIVDVALETADQHHASRITGVTVVVGDLAHISDDAVRFHFEMLSNGTAAEGAMVTIRREAAGVSCRDCDTTSSPVQEPVCPACGSLRVEVTGGELCYLESIDVEDGAQT